MSYKKVTCSSDCKDQENRSRKWCACGGHNAHNMKRNLHHHSTAVRLKRRRQRRAKALRKEGALNVRDGARRIEYNVEGFRF